ncbi:transcriptional regulator, TetR family [Quadrisphaera granulorum]|uniref:TetR family transcriptional regulator n=1 Tax=Quadrisphaera granulorum TaxID=317664 RepID=A0A316ABL9_9ACTN|nr:TetR/AcrR family transcriptional regulator [Quadrisphaera granulorum]PWJ47217.1 TetR family transcriptional regulator [Quadrisphaera granulorum]SZE98903.1 transcriptional regulator, TetR family [Quadrisphaera granulorum]
MVRSRAAVVAGAAELLLNDGPGAVTIDAVVQRTGVARSTIYRHFPTSTDVLRAAVEAVLPVSVPGESGDDDGERPNPTQLRDALRRRLRATADHLVGGAWTRALPALLELVARDPSLEEHRAQIVARHREPLLDLLRVVRDAGLLPADADLAVVADRLLGPLFYRRLVSGEPLTHELCDHLVDTVLTPGDPR